MARHIGKLGVAALGAIVLAAAVGASSASATRLCEEQGVSEKCPAGKIIPANTKFEAVLRAEWRMNLGFVFVTCNASTLKGEVSEAGGGLGVPVGMAFESFSWGGCTCAGKGATVKGQSPAWVSSLTGTGNKDGELTIPVNFKIECLGNTCYYLGTPVNPFYGGKPAIFEINNVAIVQKGSSEDCATTETWTASYEFESPTQMWVTKE